jgi:beta-lactamase regulating signal transducer with metallopeptidase domain
MENSLLYFAKVNGLIILFYLLYLVVLSKETFYVSNRLYLLWGLVISIFLPLITFTKTVWVNPEPISKLIEVVPITDGKKISTVSETPIDWSLILSATYSLIAIIILLKVGFEIASFFYKIIRLNKQKETNYTLIYTNSTENPFSFFKYIVINPTLFSKGEFEHILTHERIHAKQWHSIDVLFSKIFCAVFWINPISWLYRKAMLHNLEFIADNQSLEKIESKYEYQKTLLKVVVHQQTLGITNPFYQSLIKKRIIMLHKNQSHKRNAWKYATILPVLVGFMLLFQIETIAQVKENSKVAAYAVEVEFDNLITSKTTDGEIKKIENSFNEDNILKISNIKRNKEGEIIEIRLEFSSKNNSKNKNIKIVQGDKPIKPIRIFIKEDKNNEKSVGFEEVSNLVSVKYDALKVEETAEIETDTTNYTIDNMVKNGKKVNLIINGQLQTANVKSRIPFDQEFDIFKELDEKNLKSKYNIDKKEGETYFEITTKKVSNSINSVAKYTFVVDSDYSEDETFSRIDRIKDNKTVDAKRALIILDGKEIDYQDLDKIDPKTISTSGNIIGSEAQKKYGKKGENGVIFINTKKNE